MNFSSFITISLAALLLSCSAHKRSEEKKDYLQETRLLVKRGNYEEALKRFIWFDDHILEADPGMAGVRRSFALSDWKELGDKYPPALAELKKRRDTKTDGVLAKGGPRDYFTDVVAINRTLEENIKTVQLFEAVSHHYPALARQTFENVVPYLMEAKRYDLIHQYLHNPVQHYEKTAADYQLLQRDIGRGANDYEVSAWIDEDFTKDVVKLIQYCKAVNDTDAAKEIQKRALDVVNSKKVNDALN